MRETPSTNNKRTRLETLCETNTINNIEDEHEIEQEDDEDEVDNTTNISIQQQIHQLIHSSPPQVGDRIMIEVNNKLLPGEVVKINLPTIEFDDGQNFPAPMSIDVLYANVENNVPRGRIWLDGETQPQQSFQIGQRVLGNWQNNNVLYSGTITNIIQENNQTISVDISYDDGDKEYKVPLERVRDEQLIRDSPPDLVRTLLPATAIHEDDEVHVEINDQLMDSVVVTKINDDGTFNILFMILKEEVFLGRIWKTVGGNIFEPTSGSETFVVGQRVLGNWKNNKILYSGHVTDVDDENHTVNITYDDGDVEIQVPMSRVRDEEFGRGDRLASVLSVNVPSPWSSSHPQLRLNGILLEDDDGDGEEDDDQDGSMEYTMLIGMRNLLKRMENTSSSTQDNNGPSLFKVRLDIASLLMNSKHHKTEAIPFIRNELIASGIHENDGSAIAVGGMLLEKLGDYVNALQAFQIVFDMRQRTFTTNSNEMDDDKSHRFVDAHIYMSRVLQHIPTNTTITTTTDKERYISEGINIVEKMKKFNPLRAKLSLNLATTLVQGVVDFSLINNQAIDDVVNFARKCVSEFHIHSLFQTQPITDKNDSIRDGFLELHRALLGMGKPSSIIPNVELATTIAEDFITWIRNQNKGEHSHEMITTYIIIGNGLGLVNRSVDALPYLKRAIELADGQSHSEKTQNLHCGPHAYYMLAKNLWFTGERKESLKMMKKCREMCIERGIGDEEQGVGLWSKEDEEGFGDRLYSV
jgi:hypothetical protein